MNNYQRTGVLIVRIVAAGIFLFSFLSLVEDSISLAMPPRPSPIPGLAASFPVYRLFYEGIKAAFGLLLWLYAIPIGRLLGKGLD